MGDKGHAGDEEESMCLIIIEDGNKQGLSVGGMVTEIAANAAGLKGLQVATCLYITPGLAHVFSNGYLKAD